MTSTWKRLSAAGLCLCFIGTMSLAQNTADPLKKGFEDPPQSARPRVWWHWMNGNITKEGIKLDLEWMHRAGLAASRTSTLRCKHPQVVRQRLAYMTPEWKDAFKYATTLADQLGMERPSPARLAGASRAARGYLASQGMKKYVWSETDVEGGKPFTGTLRPSAVQHRRIPG